MEEFHRPVLLKEAIDFLQVKPGGVYVDATVGGGGYAAEILRRGGKLIGIDCDPEAVEETCRRLKQLKELNKESWQLFNENFNNLKNIIKKAGFQKIDGIVFDLGASLHQFKTANRGFTFLKDAPLDMRMDPSLKVRAADLINALTEQELYVLFTKFGQESMARPIARAIIGSRRIRPIETTGELSEIVEKVYQRFRKKTKIHAATKVFQALRIAVNDELENLKSGLLASLAILSQGGRLVVVSFHSLEDGIVKDFLRGAKGSRELELLTAKPIVPSVQEVSLNPSARSAKLRAAIKL